MMSTTIESQLAAAQRELASLRAQHQEFAYIVSHDLNAPLRQIAGFADIVATKHADSFDDKTKRHFKLIVDGSTQVNKILASLMSYSNLCTEPTAFSKLSLVEVVDDAIKALSEDISESGAIITCKNLPKIVGNGLALKQLFVHIIHNALLYQLPGNQPDIVISAIEAGNVWQLCVSDNGIGVAENLTEKIFKVLKRGVSQKKYEGMGMGLALAKKIAQKHGGDIWMESNNEVGTSFYFTIAKDLPNG
jgi:light-regulated signal transduction histidine kinase (bacteriophytochrome)